MTGPASVQQWSFRAPVWQWREGTWRFVTVPEAVSDEVDEAVGDEAAEVVGGLGLHAGGDLLGEEFEEEVRHGGGSEGTGWRGAPCDG